MRAHTCTHVCTQTHAHTHTHTHTINNNINTNSSELCYNKTYTFKFIQGGIMCMFLSTIRGGYQSYSDGSSSLLVEAVSSDAGTSSHTSMAGAGSKFSMGEESRLSDSISQSHTHTHVLSL